ncbi:tyrosine-type recombinase/integrase [Micromonospora taraxaci]|uniref:tyrosine-type recombinase/integrase n=1 Tax=Micromonospora taraxaci TaxID=1316803 RepID=UPI0033B59948
MSRQVLKEMAAEYGVCLRRSPCAAPTCTPATPKSSTRPAGLPGRTSASRAPNAPAGYDHRQSFETGAEDLIFVARTGEPLKRGTFRARIWKPSLQLAGLPLALRFHDLRHSYATWPVSVGVPINDVAKVMGHEQTSTTLDRYTHSTRDRDARVVCCLLAATG